MRFTKSVSPPFSNMYSEISDIQQYTLMKTHLDKITPQVGDMNNNQMERLNGEFRDREKVVRGIKKDDSVIIDGYQLYHNYVRPHMALHGKTPADKAEIIINGENKWKMIIQNASKR